MEELKLSEKVDEEREDDLAKEGRRGLERASRFDPMRGYDTHVDSLVTS